MDRENRSLNFGGYYKDTVLIHLLCSQKQDFFPPLKHIFMFGVYYEN